MVLGGAGAMAAYMIFNKFTSPDMIKKNDTFISLERQYPLLSQLSGLDAAIQLNIYKQRFPVKVKQVLDALEKAARFYTLHLQNVADHSGVKKYAIMANRQFSSVIAHLTELQTRCLNAGVPDKSFQENVSEVMELLQDWQHNLALNS